MIEAGTILQNRYLIKKQIGAGGMGAVYLAVDQRFESCVAIKETFYKDDELGEAFEREARLLNGLHHPNLPHVSDYFSENSGHFLVMQFIEGEDLFEILKRKGSFPVPDVLRWTNSLLDALDYLHSLEPPIIHRDIKPQNLKITARGDIILLDFGLAKLNSDDASSALSVFGYSRKYSPLEQIEGTGTDARSDIFALGATVYHLLTGKPPIDALARASAIVAGNADPLKSASEIDGEISVGIASVLNSALALNAAARFVSAKAMRQALAHAVNLDLAEKTEKLPIEAIADVPAENGVIISPDTENFPALEAFAAETATGSPQTGNDDKPGTIEISIPNARMSTPAPEVLPPGLVNEEATKVSSARSNQSRFSIAALLVLLSCAGLAAGYFVTRVNSSNEPSQTSVTQTVPASNTNTEQSASISDSPSPETSGAPLLEKTEQPKTTRVKSEPIAERPETAAKKETGDGQSAQVETTQKTKSAPKKSQTSQPTSRQSARRSESRQNGETRPRVVADPVPDIESIFTGRPSSERDERIRRREERRRRANGNHYPF